MWPLRRCIGQSRSGSCPFMDDSAVPQLHPKKHRSMWSRHGFYGWSIYPPNVPCPPPKKKKEDLIRGLLTISPLIRPHQTLIFAGVLRGVGWLAMKAETYPKWHESDVGGTHVPLSWFCEQEVMKHWMRHDISINLYNGNYIEGPQSYKCIRKKGFT